jgi:hypothetical protein
VFKNVTVAQQKDDLYCVWVPEDNTTYKFPLAHIWCIEEDYSDETETVEDSLVDMLGQPKSTGDRVVSMRLLDEEDE